MLVGFGNMIFFHCVGKPIQDWIFQLGLQAASWSTAAIANTWLNEVLFVDMAKVNVPTLILHGLNDRVCLYPLAVAQNKGIKNSKLVSFQQCGHFLFYDQMDKSGSRVHGRYMQEPGGGYWSASQRDTQYYLDRRTP